MGEVTHTDKGNGVQMSFYTSLYHTYQVTSSVGHPRNRRGI